ncbi:hypothetical protein CYMTET_15936 [Cymbomonas tetramitiformis]|uniref:Uncharacterized protein n=1 Tax=Cymbomonas tetramitiformis TaxID=36881 RepID=A0AAE0GDD3_9CHLO|nr:hypothetical protein CYMTET_15936 [Cymbomonas tetramitiformis]
MVSTPTARMRQGDGASYHTAPRKNDGLLYNEQVGPIPQDPVGPIWGNQQTPATPDIDVPQVPTEASEGGDAEGDTHLLLEDPLCGN